MRFRPKRDNYPNGKYGDIDYLERLERYCTFLENKINKSKITPTASEIRINAKEMDSWMFDIWYKEKMS